MAGYVLCPSCADGKIGEMYEVVKLCTQGFINSEMKKHAKVDRGKAEMNGKFTGSYGHILDAFGITKYCCRMHIMGTLGVSELLYGYEAQMQNNLNS